MYAKYGIVFLVMLFILSLVACTPARNSTMQVIDSTESGLSYIQSTKTEREVDRFLRRDTTIDSIDQNMGLDYIKPYPDGFLSVIQTESGLLLLRFTQEGEYLFAERIDLSETLTEEKMNAIVPGMTIADVMDIDPDGFYRYKYTSSSLARKDSYHYTGSGVCYEIIYDENLIVTEVRSYLL